MIHHLEPDHAGGIADFVAKYPEATLVASAKAFALLPQFMTLPESVKKQTVKEGDTLALGSHTLQFIGAPMVHWPEVLFSYEQSEKVLFAADAFGKFGVYDADPDDWACEARRYYFNIVGKYGNQVQSVLKKAAALDIKTICPLHGPVLTENLGYYIDKYNTWSSYAPEDKGVLVAFASIYGGTKKATPGVATLPKTRACSWHSPRFTAEPRRLRNCSAKSSRPPVSRRWWFRILPAATWPKSSKTPSATIAWWWQPPRTMRASSRLWKIS